VDLSESSPVDHGNVVQGAYATRGITVIVHLLSWFPSIHDVRLRCGDNTDSADRFTKTQGAGRLGDAGGIYSVSNGTSGQSIAEW
jgi:hypothetical protein